MQKNNLKALRLNKMVDEIEDYAILLLDRLGNIETWNRGAEHLKGYAAREILGSHFSIFYTPEDRQAGRPEYLLHIAAEKGSASDEGWRVRKDGSRFWGKIVITAIHDNDEIIGFTKVTKDLTAQKLSEQMQERYMHQLEARSKEMEQLAYIASHDLQEPLRTISRFTELLKMRHNHQLDEEGQMYLEIVHRSTGRMRELIKGILEYSLLGASREIVPVDLNELLDDLRTDLSNTISTTGTVIESQPMPVIHGYKTELRQLFQNLISNAIKFRKPDEPSVVRISGERNGEHWQFAVLDQGIGIESRFLEKIFLIFQRLHPRDQYPGTGIGLAYVRKIVELHDGKIWVESEPEVGSKFYFTLRDMKPL